MSEDEDENHPLEAVDTSEDEEENHPLNGHCYKPHFAAYIPGCSRHGATDFSRIEVAITVKATELHDPFRDLPPLDERPATDNDARVEADTSKGIETLVQMTTCVAQQMGQQLRHWVFSVIICGDYARLVRWDRSGAVFTSRFDYKTSDYKTSDHLEKFFTRYGGLDKGPRGVDTKVAILEDNDPRVKIAKEGIGFKPQHDPQPLFYEFRLDLDLTVIGYSPKAPTASLVGRATRPFIVWDPVTQKRRFLKDTWRIDLPGMVVEGETYELLESKEVPNVASVIWHGDVDGRQTLSSKLCINPSDTYAVRPLTPHKHYRLVLDKVGWPCTEYNNQYHFFTVVRQVMKGEPSLSPTPDSTSTYANVVIPAHWLAYHLAEILHGDIGVWSIMIDEDGNGMLMDWDFSKPAGTQGGQTVNLLNFSSKPTDWIALVGHLGIYFRCSFARCRRWSFLPR